MKITADVQRDQRYLPYALRGLSLLFLCGALFPSAIAAAPSTVTSLTASQGYQAQLTWIAPDNGSGGAATAYLLKYSTSVTIADDAEFTQAATYYQNWTPASPGALETRLLTGLIPDATYWFSLRSSYSSEWSAISATGTNKAAAGGFWLAWSSPESDQTNTVAWGDYDNDGDLDMLVGNNGQNGTANNPNRVYRNDGDGVFTLVWSAPSGGQWSTAYWGDYDNDGDLDIFTGNLWEFKQVFRNEGNDTFTSVWASWGWQTWAVATGDCDNDGDLDILDLLENTNSRIFRNDGAGVFTQVPLAISGRDGFWGDYDNDGDLDIILVSYNYLSVYRNDGSYVFTRTVNQYVTDDIYSIAGGDYDNDGDLDIAIGANNRNNRVYRNDDGVFTNTWTASTAFPTRSIAWGDYDNDGDLDLTVGNYGQQSVVYRNDNGNFILRWNSPSADTHGIAWGDIDNDGDLDMVLGNYAQPNRVYVSEYARKVQNTPPSAPSSLSNSFSNGHVAFQWGDAADAQTPSAGLYYSIRIGKTSLSQATVSGSFGSPLLGNYPHTRVSAGQLGIRLMLKSDTTYYWSVQAVDSGLKAGNWSVEQSTYIPKMNPSPVDGLTAVKDSQIKISWRSPFGDATSYELRYTTSGPITDEAGWDAAAVYAHNWTPSPVGVVETKMLTGFFLNTTYYFALKSSNTYGASPLDTSAPEPASVPGQFYHVWTAGDNVNTTSVAWGDYDNDGDLDHLVGKNYGQNRVYRNDGNGQFSIGWQSVDNLRTNWVDWGDYDNDGDLDFVTAQGTNEQNRIYRNNGNGSFTRTWIAPAGNYSMGVDFGDYDSDGDLDILVGNTSTTGYDGVGFPNQLYRNDGGDTFTLVWTSTETERTQRVQWGDCDNDGDLDFLTINRDNPGVRVYENLGKGQFASIWSGGGSASMGGAWADCDNDGDLDILVALGFGANDQLYRNDWNEATQTKGFSQIWNQTSGWSGESVAWGDYDNDGDFDQFTGNTDQPSELFLNDGFGYLTRTWITPMTSYNVSSVAAGDYDNDGDLDLLEGITAGGYNRVYRNCMAEFGVANSTPNAPSGLSGDYSSGDLYLRWNAGTDSAPGATAANLMTYNLRVGTVSGSSNTVSGACGATLGSNFFRSMLSGSQPGFKLAYNRLQDGVTYYWSVQTIDAGLRRSAWSAEQSVCYNAPPGAVTDLAAATSAQVVLTWSAPGDDGYYRTATRYEIRYSSSVPFDWNAATVWKVNRPVSGTVGTRETEVITGLCPEVTYYFRIKTADEVNNWSGLSAGATTQAGWFSPVWYAVNVDTSYSVAWGDYDNDGDFDQLVANYGQPNRVYRNEGNGTFTNTWTAPSGYPSMSAAWGDYDNDGDLDLLVSNYGQPNRVYRNEGNGTFTNTWTASSGFSSMSAAWGDYDNDGDLDLLAADYYNANQLYRNDSGTFVNAWSSQELENTTCVIWGDYDNDGDLDQLVANDNRNNRVYRNDGGDTFVVSWSSPETDYTYSVAWGDYDNDGDLDQLVGNYGQPNRVYRNDGGAFSLAWSSTESDNTTSVAWGDFDNDGDLDQLVGNYGGSSYVYRNTGGDNFVRITPSFGTGSTRSVAWGDYDNDGDLDILMANYGEANRIYRNYLAEFGGGNTPPAAPSGGFSAAYSGYSHYLRWNAGTDSGAGATPANGLYYAVRVGAVTGSSSTVSGTFGSPLLGNYLRPKTSAGQLGIKLNIRAETTFYWQVQTIDAGLRRSAWSAEQYTFINVAPATINDLSATSGNGEVTLRWSAPGDDGNYWQNSGGTVQRYIVRYSTEGAINTDGKFDTARDYANNWAPIGPGYQEVRTVTGLVEGTYYFAIKTRDENNNLSGLSNSVSAVSSGIIAKLVFINAPQTLDVNEISGPFTIEARDRYDSPVRSTENVTITLQSTSDNCEFSQYGAEPWGVTGVTLLSGQSTVGFYYRDRKSGTPTLTASCPSRGWTAGTQAQAILPGPAHHFTLTHDGEGTVQVSEPVTIRAYDQYNNMTSGYTGTVQFVPSGSATVQPSSHTFVLGDNDTFVFQLRDTRVETVQVTAVDVDTPTITGTSSNMPFGGTYVSGTTSLSPTEVFQLQQDVPLLRFDLRASSGTSNWTRLRIDRTGDCSDSDVTRAKIYRDNGNGTFASSEDVLIGSGTFTAGWTSISVATEAITSTLSIYYIAYDMSTDAAEGKTVGAEVDTVGYFTFTSGLNMGLNNVPFSCSTATIVGTPRTLFASAVNMAPAEVVQGQSNVPMLKTRLFTDFGQVNWRQLRINKTGTCNNSDIKGIALWRDDSGDELLGTGDQMVSSGTLVSGSVNLSFNEPVNVSTMTFFFVADIAQSAGTGVTFGLECAAPTYFGVNSPHSVSGANFPLRSSTTTIKPTTDILTVAPENIAPADVLQGSTTVRMLKLTLSVNANATLWSGIRVDRTGTSADSDVSAVMVLRDDGTVISAGNDTFVGGTANIILTQIQTIAAGTPKTYYLSLSVAPNATLNRTVGLRCATSDYFTLSSPDFTAEQNFPMASIATNITEYPDTVVVVSSSIAPGSIDPGAQNVPLVRMQVATDLSAAQWSALRIDRFGTLADADISAVRLFRDANANGVYDMSDTLISSGVFAGNIATLTFASTQTVTPAAQTYFVTVSLKSSAVPNSTLGIRYQTNAYVTVNPPNTVSASGFPFDTSVVQVNEPPAQVTVTAASLMPTGVTQGDYFVAVERLEFRTDVYNATLRTLRLNLAGTGVDGDVLAIRIFRDNGDGVFDKDTDQLVSAGTDRFSFRTANVSFVPAQGLSTTPQTYFVVYDISETATPGATCGLNLTSEGFIVVDAPDTVSGAGFPVNSGLATISATVDTLMVTPVDLAPLFVTQADTDRVFETFTLQADNHQIAWTALRLQLTGTGSDGDISAVRIYRDENSNGVLDISTDTLISPSRSFTGGEVTIPLTDTEILTASAKRYLIVCDISQTATPGAMVGVGASSTTCFSVNAPDVIAAAGFPWSSSQSPVYDQPDTLAVTGQNLAGDTVDQAKLNAPFLRFNLKVDHDRTTVTRMRVTKTGTLNETRVSSVNLYYDANNNGLFEPQTDQLIGTGNFTGGVVNIDCVPQTITTAARAYFVACSIELDAEVGETLGVQFAAVNAFTVSSSDLVSASGLPLASALARVRDIRTPTMPQVADGGEFTYNFEQLRVSWASEVVDGQLVDCQYAVGTSTGGTDVRGWQRSGTNGAIDIKGLSLENNKTYYVLVKTKSSYDFWSDVGVSDGITVDLVEPEVAGTPTLVRGESTYMITWPPAQSGVSGIVEYELQERQGYAPRWVTVSSTTLAAPLNAGSARQAPPTSQVFVDKTGGTYYYRVRAKNGAGRWSDFSPATRVVHGAAPDTIISQVSSYPNPFDSRRGRATIHYYLNQDTGVRIRIYDLFGHFVREMELPSGSNGGWVGSNEITWDGTDKDGSKVSMGGYLAIITSDARGAGNEAKVKIAVVH